MSIIKELRRPIVLLASALACLGLNLLTINGIQGFPLAYTTDAMFSFWVVIVDFGIGVGVVYLLTYEARFFLSIAHLVLRYRLVAIGLYLWAVVRINFMQFGEERLQRNLGLPFTWVIADIDNATIHWAGVVGNLATAALGMAFLLYLRKKALSAYEPIGSRTPDRRFQASWLDWRRSNG